MKNLPQERARHRIGHTRNFASNSRAIFEFEGQLNRNQSGGMVDGAPRTQLQHRSLRSGMPSYSR